MANSWDPIVGTEEYISVLKRAEDYAKANGLKLNPEEERVQKVIGLMTMNLGASGDYYCPCKQTKPLDPKTDTVCPCPEIGEELEKKGHCFCKLFYTPS